MADEVTTLELANDIAILRAAVGSLRWLLIEDQDVEAATTTLNRKLFERMAQLDTERGKQQK